MPTEDTHMPALAEDRPGRGVVVRHRDAAYELRSDDRGAPRVDLRRGAVWVRATDAGPGVLLTHGATTVQVRSGAAVIEVHDFEALLVVVAGRAAVKGTAALPRSVSAGHALALALDGTLPSPEALAPAELAADRFITENLARDAMATARLTEVDDRADSPAAPGATAAPGAIAPAEPPPPSVPASARVDSLAPPAPVGDEASGPVATGVSRATVGAPPGSKKPADAAETVDGPVTAPTDGRADGISEAPGEWTEPPERSRTALVVTVVVLALLAAVVGAVVLRSDPAGALGLALAVAGGAGPG